MFENLASMILQSAKNAKFTGVKYALCAGVCFS